MLEQRVERPEHDVLELKSDVKDLQLSMARVEGKLDIKIARTPTPLQLWGMILGTWTAGVGNVCLLIRFQQP